MTTELRSLRCVCVFCGARSGARPEYLRLAREFGDELARRHAQLIYGAGGAGIMAAVAEAARTGGARVIGIIPQHLFDKEKPDISSEEIFIARSMHHRKSMMYRMATGFVALPGGLGTFEELMEAATWNQIGIHNKPTVILNCENYFDPLIATLDHAVAEGFLTPAERLMVRTAETVGAAFDLLGWPDSREATGVTRSVR